MKIILKIKKKYDLKVMKHKKNILNFFFDYKHI